MKDLYVPCGTKKAVVTIVETGFGKGKTTITSFFGRDNNLLQRYIDKTSTDYFERTASTYKLNSSLRHNKISTKTVNNRLTQEKTEDYVMNGKILERNSLIKDYKDNQITETQLFEHLAPHSKKHYIKTILAKDNKGNIRNKTITGNVTTQEELNEMAKSPYMFSMNYGDEEFIRAIEPYAKQLQKVEDVQVNIKPIKQGYLGLSHDTAREIDINLAKHHGNRAEMVDTINHELRHQYQNELVDALEAETPTLRQTLSNSIAAKKTKKQKRIFKTITLRCRNT